VTFEPIDLKLYVEDNETKAEVIVVTANTGDVDVNPGATKNLFENDLTLKVGTSTGELAPGKAYTVKLLLDGELQDEVLNVYVKNDVKTAKSVTVKGVAATGSGTSYSVELPFGTDLTKLVASDIVVVPTDANAAVETAVVATGGTSATVKVIAEDETDATINITITADQGDNTDLSSTIYAVDNSAKTITMAVTADVDVFKANLKAATGATFEVYETDGTTIKVGDMVTGDKVIVTALDGSTTATYTVAVQQ